MYVYVLRVGRSVERHYDNTPIYWKFTTKNGKFSDKKFWYFFKFLLKNIDCGYSLEPPRRGGSNEYPQSMFMSRNKRGGGGGEGKGGRREGGGKRLVGIGDIFLFMLYYRQAAHTILPPLSRLECIWLSLIFNSSLFESTCFLKPKYMTTLKILLIK